MLPASEDNRDRSTTTDNVMAARNGQSRPGKRPIKNVSPADKVGAIDRVHEGESKASVARDIGVPESTLRGWCKSEHKIRSQCNNASAEMIARHSPVSISNGRSMSASGRQSVNSRHSSNSRQSATPPEEDGPPLKRVKIERTGRQNSPQNVLAGPSTSSAGSYMGRLDNRGIIGSQNYAALMTSMATMTPEQSQLALQHLSLLPSLAKEFMSINHTVRGNTVGLVENGLQYTRANNATFPTMVSSSTAINNAATNIGGIDSVRGTVGSMIGNAMGNALDHTIGNRNIAVAPTQGATSSYTRKSPNVTPAAEAPTTPAPASPHENNAQPTTSRPRGTATAAGTNVRDEAFWNWLLQQYQEIQRLGANNNLSNLGNPFDTSKGWFLQWMNCCNWPQKEECSSEQSTALLNYLFSNNAALNTNGDDNNSEIRARSHSVASERSESQEEREDSPTTIAATTERATLTTPPVIEPTLPPHIKEIVRTAKTSPSNADIEKAIEYGTWLQEWLNNCSVPLLTTRHVVTHKYIVDVLKWVKDSSKMKTEVVSSSCRTSAGSHDEATQL